MGVVAPLVLLGVIVAVVVGIALLVAVVGPLSRAFGWVIRRTVGFIGGMLRDALRLVGAVVASVVFVPLIVINVLIGRWSASSHYGRAFQAELAAMGGCLYRMLIGHWIRLFGLSDLTEGIERRVPEAVMAAPTADRPRGGKAGQFPGYEIVGSLPGGGSGGKLFVAAPTAEKRAAFVRAGQFEVDRVVIKAFSLRDGSTLPQIIRENRALPAARRLGLILEHELNEERFYYVTRYVPGESLALVGQRLHAESGPDGLDTPRLRAALGYAADLLRTLRTYHDGGLWHKDVKPDNIIVADGAAHLVDFGLITPLRSSMTLTTHGTEYFRDPEMVRMALRGVKVHEVDGSRFDLYAAGAVLYSVIEDSFPAHAGLSQISRRCPDAVKWIIRRAMTDYDKRYASAGLMLADVETVIGASDPFALKPVDLPSVRAGGAGAYEFDPAAIDAASGNHRHPWEADEPRPSSVRAASFGGAAAAVGVGNSFAGSAATDTPRLRVTDWWTGRYAIDPPVNQGHTVRSPEPRPHAPRPSPRAPGSSAAEQLVRARARVREARDRAQGRMDARRRSFEPAGVNAGVVIALLIFVGLVAVVLIPSMFLSRTVIVPPTFPKGNPAPEDGAWTVGSYDLDLTAWNRSPSPVRDSERPEVLVLRDSVAFAPSAVGPIDRAIESMRKAGFTIGGEAASTNDAGPSDFDQSIQTAASLRAAIGISPFGSEEARSAIQDWLLQTEGSNRVVVWIARASDSAPAVWVLTPGAGRQPGLNEVVSAFGALSEPSDQTVDGSRERSTERTSRSGRPRERTSR
ncbi:MAG: hypothetical protein KF768_08690 [Phycisphaeraceae bacterium]|nr:hypothetical protein [Phycisphaeraceae bacterium]